MRNTFIIFGACLIIGWCFMVFGDASNGIIKWTSAIGMGIGIGGIVGNVIILTLNAKKGR